LRVRGGGFRAGREKTYAKSTYICDLASIPVEDDRFDAIIFNQTMEHLPRPLAVLCELQRVLKPGGTMICTAPLFYEEHEAPYDFYRYTQFAWHHLMQEAGLEIVSLRWMEGYFGTVAYQLFTAAKYLPVKPKEIAPGILGLVASPIVAISRAAFFAIGHLFAFIDERERFTGRGFPKNYVVIVSKPNS
jgi:SAM-dependent methyltransferase